MPEFDLGRLQISLELPNSLSNCDQRINALREKYQLLESNRKLYKTQREYWKKYGETLQNINAELQVLKAWRKAIVRLVDKDLSKEAIARNVDLTSAEGVIRSLYCLVETRLSHERPLKEDEKPAMLAAINWLREWRSIVLADRIEPDTLVSLETAQATKKPKKKSR